MAATLKTYEKKCTELEELVRRLDEEDLSLNDMFAQYKKGLTLVKDCADVLRATEEELNQLIAEVRIHDAR